MQRTGASWRVYVATVRRTRDGALRMTATWAMGSTLIIQQGVWACMRSKMCMCALISASAKNVRMSMSWGLLTAFSCHLCRDLVKPVFSCFMDEMHPLSYAVITNRLRESEEMQKSHYFLNLNNNLSTSKKWCGPKFGRLQIQCLTWWWVTWLQILLDLTPFFLPLWLFFAWS